MADTDSSQRANTAETDETDSQPDLGAPVRPETDGADVAADILLKALDKPPKKPRGRPRAKV